MFVSDSFYSSFFIIFISFSAQSLKKQKKQNKNVVLRVISIHYHTEHQLLLLTYKHRQFHWTRGASKLGVFCFVFFFCFLRLLVRLLKAFRFLWGKVKKKKDAVKIGRGCSTKKTKKTNNSNPKS